MTTSNILIWWLSQSDYSKIPAERPTFIPSNIWREVNRREGRAGRYRLWIPDNIEYQGMPELPEATWESFKTLVPADVGGIVVSQKHAKACLNLCGVITDENLNIITK